MPDPSTRTQICAHVKDPTLICRTRVGLTASGMKTRKHCTQEKKMSVWIGDTDTDSEQTGDS